MLIFLEKFCFPFKIRYGYTLWLYTFKMTSEVHRHNFRFELERFTMMYVSANFKECSNQHYEWFLQIECRLY